jgi:hypothetical protein
VTRELSVSLFCRVHRQTFDSFWQPPPNSLCPLSMFVYLEPSLSSADNSSVSHGAWKLGFLAMFLLEKPLFCHCPITFEDSEQKTSVLEEQTWLGVTWKYALTVSKHRLLLAPMNSISGGSWQQFVHVIHKHSHIVFLISRLAHNFHKSSGGNSPSWVSLYSKTAS